MKNTSSEMSAILAEATEEGRRAMVEILRLERDHLPQKNPSPTKLAREIADIIRKKAVP
jgi:hypothetical protein